MKRQKLKWMGLCLAGALVTQASFAQQESTGTSGKDTESMGGKSSSQVNKETRLSQILGSDVKGKDSEVLGQVDDFLINPQNGQVRYAIVGEQGTAGSIKRRIPVPWPAANLQKETELNLNLSKQQFQSAPTLTQERYAELQNNPTVVVEIYRFYQLEPPTAMGAPGTQGGVEKGQGNQDTQPKPDQEDQDTQP